MPKRTADYRSLLLEDLRDPEEAANYLTAALHDSEEMFLLALRDVAEAHQMANVAGKVGVSRESLYRMLARSGNPTYRNFFGILKALDVVFDKVQTRGAIHNQPRPIQRRRRPQRKSATGQTRSIGYATEPTEENCAAPVLVAGPVNENAILSEPYAQAIGLYRNSFTGTATNPSCGGEPIPAQQQATAA